jgi:hypothetical protein
MRLNIAEISANKNIFFILSKRITTGQNRKKVMATDLFHFGLIFVEKKILRWVAYFIFHENEI